MSFYDKFKQAIGGMDDEVNKDEQMRKLRTRRAEVEAKFNKELDDLDRQEASRKRAVTDSIIEPLHADEDERINSVYQTQLEGQRTHLACLLMVTEFLRRNKTLIDDNAELLPYMPTTVTPDMTMTYIFRSLAHLRRDIKAHSASVVEQEKRQSEAQKRREEKNVERTKRDTEKETEYQANKSEHILKVARGDYRELPDVSPE